MCGIEPDFNLAYVAMVLVILLLACAIFIIVKDLVLSCACKYEFGPPEVTREAPPIPTTKPPRGDA